MHISEKTITAIYPWAPLKCVVYYCSILTIVRIPAIIATHFSGAPEFIKLRMYVGDTSGREACTRDMGLEDVGVKIDSESRYIIGGHKDFETSSVPHIHAIGDVLKVEAMDQFQNSFK